MITGIERVIFSIISFVIVLVFTQLRMSGDSPQARWLEALGWSTYGIYLLHPVIYEQLRIDSWLSADWPDSWVILVVIPLGTIVCAIFCFRFLETPAIKFARRTTAGVFSREK